MANMAADYYKNKREMPLDYLQQQSTVPEVDFSRATLAEQMPQEDMMEKQVTAGTPDMKADTLAQQMPAAQGDVAIDAASKGLMTFGDPSMKALGLGLATASQIKAGQNQRAQQEYQAEVAKINARQNAINRLAEMGSRMKA